MIENFLFSGATKNAKSTTNWLINQENRSSIGNYVSHVKKIRWEICFVVSGHS